MGPESPDMKSEDTLEDHARAAGETDFAGHPVTRRGVLRAVSMTPEACLVVLLAFLVGFISYTVISRYFLNRSLAFSDEVSRLLFVWVVFLGAAIGVKRRQHLGLTVAHRLMPTWAKDILIVATEALVAFIAAILLWQGIEVLQLSSAQRLPASRISVTWLYLSVPVSSFLMLLYALINVVRMILDPEFRHEMELADDVGATPGQGERESV